MTDAEGRVHAGVLRQFTGGLLILGESKDEVRLAPRDLVAVRWGDRVAAAPSAGDSLVLLANGDTFALRPETIDEEFLTGRGIRSPAGPVLKVPLEAVRGIVFNLPLNQGARGRVISQLFDRTDTQDLIILNNGDAVTGELLSLDEKSFHLRTGIGETKIDRGGVRAVGVNPELTSLPALSGEGAIVTLTDGSRFHARKLQLARPDALSLETQFGAALNVPLSTVVALQFLGGRATYLSDLEPAAYRFEPFFGLTWPLRRDRTVDGQPLRLRGVGYAKGLGMHSQSEATYRLDGKFRRFQATIGIDDGTEGKGSVIFQVLCDGKPAYTSPVLTGTSRPVALDPIDVSRVQSLKLRIDYATQGDILDHADWCDAIVVK